MTSPRSAAPAVGDVVRACFGDRCLDATVVSFAPESEPTITISVPKAELRGQPLDYAALLRVFGSGGPDARELAKARAAGVLLFTGYVERVRAEGDSWRVDAAARIDPTKSRLSGTFFKLSYPEQLWSIARISGFQPEHVHIHDPAWPPPRELWLVMMPVRGVRPSEPIRVGSVVITTDPKLALIFDDAGEALCKTFRSTGVWALVPIEAAMAFDAEGAGHELIRHAINRLALLARYALSITPSGQVRPFEAGLERISLVPVVGAQTVQTGRKWLREIELIADPLELSGHFLEGLETAVRAVDRQLDLAVAAWRRATLEADASAAVVALVEALEFYVGETTPAGRPPFSKAELREVRRLIGADWNEPQVERIEWTLGKLNDPLYGLLLNNALASDGVTLSAEEESLLQQVRQIRNDVVHGRARPLLPPDELRRALALVGRILVFRAHRLSST